MKAVVLKKYGGFNTLKLSKASIPDISANQVLVKNKFSGVNYADILSRRGLYQWAPKLPYILGMESFGEVETIGRSIKDKSLKNSLIIAAFQYGGYAEYSVVNQEQILHPLDHLTDQENAAFPVNWMTAWITLTEMMRVRSKETVLINAAAGGVGTAAIQLANTLGCRVIGTASKQFKLDLIEKLGGIAVNYQEESLVKRVLDETDGRGVDAALESVGGRVFKETLQVLSPTGHAVVIGVSSAAVNRLNPIALFKAWRKLPRVNVLKMLGRSQAVSAFHLGRLIDNPSFLFPYWQELTNVVKEHDLKPVIRETFSLAEAGRAHEHIESRQSVGKVLLEP